MPGAVVVVAATVVEVVAVVGNCRSGCGRGGRLVEEASPPAPSPLQPVTTRRGTSQDHERGAASREAWVVIVPATRQIAPGPPPTVTPPPGR